jgi:TolA-binding protein
MPRFVALVAFAAFVLTTAFARVAPAARPDPALDAALAELAEGRADAGRARLEAAVRRDPQPEALCLLGRVLAHQKRPREALAVFERVGAAAPCARQAAFGRADALLALGRADEAATLYRSLGTTAFGPDRDAATAEAIVGLADRVLADPDGSRAQAIALLELAAGLRVSTETRLRLARRIADQVTAPPAGLAQPATLEAARRTVQAPEPAGAAETARATLAMGLAAPRGDVAADRLRYARLADPSAGLAALARLTGASDAETARTARHLRAALLARADLEAGLIATETLGAAALGDRDRASYAELLVRERRRGRAMPWLALLAGGEGPLAADALLQSAELAAAGPGGAEPASLYRSLLARFPTHPHARTAESRLESLRLAEARGAFVRGDAGAALAAYDALVREHPHGGTAAHALYESGLAARALNRAEDATARWRAVIERFTTTPAAGAAQVALARQVAFDAARPDDAVELLRAAERRPELAAAAAAERERWKTPELALESPARHAPGRPVQVRVLARNIPEVEMRLHRVEAEPYLRAGGTPDGLAALDVAAIAPDRRWKVPVPGHRPAHTAAWEVEVPVPGPGFYVVTASGGDHEASAVLLVSALDLVVRTVGPDLVAAVFRGGRPVSGATLLLRVDQAVQRVRTGADGLYRGPIAGGALAVLALDDGEPALLALSRGAGEAPKPTVTLGLDLDRPAYRSRDTVAFRLVARRGGRPVPGPWRVTLDGPGGELPPRSLMPGPHGSVQGELPLPPLPGPGEAVTWRVVVRLPGEDEARSAGTVRQLPERPDERRLTVTMDAPPGLGATIRVTEADGVPVEGVPVVFSDPGQDEAEGTVGRGVTDAAGRLRVEGPPEGLPFALTARVPGSGLSDAAERLSVAAGDVGLNLALAEDRLRPGERPAMLIKGGAGPVRITMVRQVAARHAPDTAPPRDPFVPTVETALRGPLSWTGTGGETLGAALEDEVWFTEVTLPRGADAEPVRIEAPPVTAGTYAVRVTALDGRVATVTGYLTCTAEGLRLRGARDARLGERLPLVVEGGPALVTAEGDRLLAARVLRPGETFEVPVQAGFTESVALVATGALPADASPDDVEARRRRVHARTVRIDTALRVTLTATASPGGLDARAEVVDGAGRPVSAEVVLTAVDETLEESVGAPEIVTAAVFRDPVAPIAPAGGVADRFAHGAVGVEVAEAVRAEVARADEDARAAVAEEGRFERNALADKLGAAVPLVEGGIGLGGIGATGHGSGAGGRGYGRGRMVQAASMVHGVTRARGERARVLWFVGRTDAEGRVAVAAPLPDRATRWRVTASALTATALGRAEARLEPAAKPGLRIARPGAVRPGDQPHLAVTVFNPTDAALSGQLDAGGAQRPVSVPPGEARTLDFGPQRPGARLDVTLRSGERVLASGRFEAPLAGGRPAADGPVYTFAVGQGGGLPLAHLALEAARLEPPTPARAARAGRAAFAALPAAGPTERVALADELVRQHAALRQQAPDTLVAAAEALLFLAEAREPLGILKGELEAAGQRVAEALPDAADAGERALGLWARARAELPVDEGALETVRAEAAGLSDENAALLAQTWALVHPADRETARGLVRGVGPNATLARRRLGMPPVASGPNPPPAADDPSLPAWLAVRASESPRPRTLTGRVPVRVGDTVAGELDLAAGGLLRLAVETGGPQPSVVGEAPGVLAWRVAPTPAGTAPSLARRIPRGPGGGPVTEAHTPPGPGSSRADVRCGTGRAPCVLAPGEMLVFDDAEGDPLVGGPAGFVRADADEAAPVRLRAVAPGRYVVAGLRTWNPDGTPVTMAPLELVVSAEAPQTPLGPDQALALAETRAAVHLAAGPLLAEEGTWPPALRAGAARILFDEALRTGAPPAELVRRFEQLRALEPTARLGLEDIGRVATAYQAAGRSERAVAVWRSGLAAAFLAEAGGARAVETNGGLLASVRLVRELAGRSPSLPVVAETLFHLPERLGALADEETLPVEVARAGITATDLRLMAAAWDREFLALHPEAPQAAEAGFHLVEGLVRLRAFRSAAEWAARLALAHPESPVVDGLHYMRGLALTELGEAREALAQFDRLATAEYPREDGTRGPAESRDDARFAAARLHEGRGELEAARAAYRAIEGHPAAEENLRALTEVRLGVEPVVRQSTREAARLRIEAANLDEVHVRIYALDLRTLFLRDGGLDDVLALRVSGVSPSWAGARPVDAGPFPRPVTLDLPVDDAGAYLVQLDGGGQEAASLLVRSDLEMFAADTDQRRVQVRWRSGEPGRGVPLRAHAGGRVLAERTDVRGVAHVPAGAPVLAFEGEHTAFLAAAPDAAAQAPDAPAPRPSGGDLDMMKNIDTRMKQQRSRNQEMYEQQIDAQPAESVEVLGL